MLLSAFPLYKFYSTVPLLDLSAKFTMKDLSLLENAFGIPIMRKMTAKKSALLLLLKIKQGTGIRDALKRWITDGTPSKINPTWEKFMCVLKLINLKCLAEKISEILSIYAHGEFTKSTAKYAEDKILPAEYGVDVTSQVTPCDGGDNSQYMARIFFIPRHHTEIDICVAILKDTPTHTDVSLPISLFSSLPFYINWAIIVYSWGMGGGGGGYIFCHPEQPGYEARIYSI